MDYIKFNHHLGKKYTHIHYDNGVYMWSIPYDNLEDIKNIPFRGKTIRNGRNKSNDTKKAQASQRTNGTWRAINGGL